MPSWWPLLSSLAHASDGRQHALHHIGFRLDEMIAAWPLLCPHQPELLAAHLLSPLSDGLGAGRNAAATALRGLGPNGTTGNAAPFGIIGYLALVASLSGHAAEVRVAAALLTARPAGLHLLLEMAAPGQCRPSRLAPCRGLLPAH